MPTLRGQTCRATAAALGYVIEWSPPRTTGIGPRARDAVHLLVDHAEAALQPCGDDRRVARVDHLQPLVRRDVELDRPGVARPPGGGRLADRPRPEPRPGPRGDRVVERRADDRDVRRVQALLVQRPRQLLERAVPVRVVREVLAGELGELVLGAELAVLDPEVGGVGHGRRTLPSRPRRNKLARGLPVAFARVLERVAHGPVRAQHGRELPERGMRHEATFSLFVRDLPPTRGFLVAAGLEPCLQFLETSASPSGTSTTSGGSSSSTTRCSTRSPRCGSRGDVWAVPEGRVVHANEPLLEITAPIAVAQLVEPYLLNQITFQTTIASKAARCVIAADGRDLVDFSLRRTQGLDAAADRRARDLDRRVRRDEQRRGGAGGSTCPSPARWPTPTSSPSRRRRRRSARSPGTSRTARRSSWIPTTR